MKYLVILLLSLLASCNGQSELSLAIIPEPLEITIKQGRVKLSGCDFDTKDDQMNALVQRFEDILSLPIDGDGVMMRLKLNDTLQKEQYHILVNDTVAMIEGGGYAGVMYGLITLEQMYSNRTIPKVEIWDKPKFEWRGFMLDASRHFWTVEQTKKVIDMLAYHKINKLHWHLTDGVGWRIEIKRYPELTKQGAWRRQRHDEAPWVKWELTNKEDSLAYGGYYTQEQIREIIAYADKRFIEVIPEIEMPGHSDAVLDCYPHLKCDGVDGRSGEFCVGKEQTYEFLCNVLDEVAGLFPSKYIHIGGDEVSTEHWKNCSDCKKQMNLSNIDQADQLHGYFIERIKKHVELRNKIVCGWDEIINSNKDSDFVVFSWTGQEAGAKAAKNGNKVVMCPLDYVYFDHYQGKHADEPQGWGGANMLKRVYDFGVIPIGLDSAYIPNIMGGQANLWVENIRDFSHVQYMLFPRLAALSEVLWSSDERKNWAHFASKIPAQIARYKASGWNYSSAAFDPYISKQWVDESGNVNVELASEIDVYDIRYTVDGTLPNPESELYDTTIVLTERTVLMAATYNQDSLVSRVFRNVDLKSKASGKPVIYNTQFNNQYNGGGESALTDSKMAFKRGDDPAWQGFEKEDLNVVIDFGESQTITTVVARFFQHMGATSVMLPKSVTVSVSDDNKTWKPIAKQEIGHINNFDAMIYTAKLEFVPVYAKYVKIQAANPKRLPPWHPRWGQNTWVFVDEITID